MSRFRKSSQGSLDQNTATERELQSIRGIGPVLAERIIAGRPYRTVDDLLKVKGIGPKRFAKTSTISRSYGAGADRPDKKRDGEIYAIRLVFNL